jgi:hypothetical protein
MAGSSQAGNLTGMLGNLADSVGKMGEAGNQYVDTFRRLQAPDVDMNDSASLLNYADYARRNGYDEEAKQYMVLGASQQKAEGKKFYTDQLAVGSEKLRKLHAQRNVIASNPQADPSALAAIDAQITTVENTLNEAGASNIYGTATDGSIASQSAVTSLLAQEKSKVEQRNLLAQTLKNEQEIEDLIDQGRLIGSQFLPHVNYDEYKLRMAQAQTPSEKIRINKSYKVMSDGFVAARKEQNETIAGQQVRVIYRDMMEEGEGIFDDDLADFLQELPEADRSLLDSVVVSKALSDPEWIRGDPEAQREIVQKYFVEQYTQFYRDDFGKSFLKREGGKSLEKSDAIADYKPNMNPDYTAEEGGGKEQFEAWYENAVTQDPSFTREEARKMWDEENKLTSSGVKEVDYRAGIRQAGQADSGLRTGVNAVRGLLERGDREMTKYEEGIARRQAGNR